MTLRYFQILLSTFFGSNGDHQFQGVQILPVVLTNASTHFLFSHALITVSIFSLCSLSHFPGVSSIFITGGECVVMLYPRGAPLLCFISLLVPSLLSTDGLHAGWLLQTIQKPMETVDA